MVRLIEALNYRCLRYIQQPLKDVQVLIGPNASGKTAFLDVISFLGDLVEHGLMEAITSRAASIEDLFFRGEGDRFELAVELEIPEERREMLENSAADAYRYVRYEIAIGVDPASNEYQILDEQVLLQTQSNCGQTGPQRTLFPDPQMPPKTIVHTSKARSGLKRVLRKVREGNDNFYPEVSKQKGKGGWMPSIRLGPRKSALANMPDDEQKFPVMTWLRNVLVSGAQRLMLNSLALRQSSRPGQGQHFRPDGGNLPWVIQRLRDSDMVRYRTWIEHIQTALPDIEDITTVELPDTRHRFLQILYQGGLKVPSWTASDGTLRLLALTLPAYLPDFEGVYLIEEPENGIHPRAMETVYQALRSVYGAQILLATHSPVILGCAETEDVLCFSKDAAGATDIVDGPSHPALHHWRESMSLTDMYASGVLG